MPNAQQVCACAIADGLFYSHVLQILKNNRQSGPDAYQLQLSCTSLPRCRRFENTSVSLASQCFLLETFPVSYTYIWFPTCFWAFLGCNNITWRLTMLPSRISPCFVILLLLLGRGTRNCRGEALQWNSLNPSYTPFLPSFLPPAALSPFLPSF